MKKISKKGFTLVELLTVIVILVAILMIAIPNITASLNRSEDKQIKAQKQSIASTANITINKNNLQNNLKYNYKKFKDGDCRITVNQLEEFNYITEKMAKYKGKTIAGCVGYKNGEMNFFENEGNNCVGDILCTPEETKQYTITYNGNGNTGGSTESTTCKANENCSLRSNGFTKTGYSFDGWYDAKSGGSKYENTTKLTNNITVYAHWKINTYTITYNGNGNTGGSTNKTDCNYNTDCSLRSNGFTKTGYTFDGWYDAKSGGSKYGNTTKLTNNITVYAHWKSSCNNSSSIKYLCSNGALCSLSNNNKILKISASGKLKIGENNSCSYSIEYALIGGGDAGLNGKNGDYYNGNRGGNGGNGGNGGKIYMGSYAINDGTYDVTIGQGGSDEKVGSVSSISSISGNLKPQAKGGSGGSGGNPRNDGGLDYYGLRGNIGENGMNIKLGNIDLGYYGGAGGGGGGGSVNGHTTICFDSLDWSETERKYCVYGGNGGNGGGARGGYGARYCYWTMYNAEMGLDAEANTGGGGGGGGGGRSYPLSYSDASQNAAYGAKGGKGGSGVIFLYSSKGWTK